MKSDKQVFEGFIQWMENRNDIVCLEVIKRMVEIYLAEPERENV